MYDLKFHDRKCKISSDLFKQRGDMTLKFKITHSLLGMSKEMFFKEPTVCHRGATASQSGLPHGHDMHRDVPYKARIF